MIGIKAVSWFDARSIANAVDRAERRVLSRFGFLVRQRAMASIKKRKAVSAPGEPPSSHTGFVKRFILYAYEPSRRSVVIGPARLNAKEEGILERLEYGGHGRLRQARRSTHKGRTIMNPKGTVVTYRARPFMRPALAKELPKLLGLWRDSVTR